MNKQHRMWLIGLGLLLTQTVNAEGLYLGFSSQTGTGDLKVTSGNVTVTSEHDVSRSPFMIGNISSNGNRSQLSFGNIDYTFKNGDDVVSGFDFDYFWVQDKGSVNLFFTLGMGVYDYQDTAKILVGNEDLSGIAVNFGAGTFVEITQNLELELSYRLKTIAWQDINTTNGVLETHSQLSHLSVGLNFKF